MDIVSRAGRSRIMAAVPQKHSRPEMVVRRMIHRSGYRYRLHVRGMPGRPDLVFPRLRKIVFVHGCFWHQHGCKRTTTPATRRAFWLEKFRQNRARDRRNVCDLRRDGWDVLVVWECWTRRPAWLENRLRAFLSAAPP